MTVTNQQAQLFDAMSNIDSQYITQALEKNVRFSGGAIRRIAAVAATVAILIGAAFAIPGFASEIYKPLFTVETTLSDSNELSIQIVSGTVGPYHPWANHPKDNLDAAWKDKDLFYVQIMVENADEKFFSDLYTVVEYNGKAVTAGSQDSNISIWANDNRGEYQRGRLCMIYGWTMDPVDFTISIYRENRTGSTLIYTQNLDISHTGYYSINGQVASPDVSSQIQNMSTEELVDTMLYDEDRFFIHGTMDEFYTSVHREYADILFVLQERSDATNIIFEKLQSLYNIDRKEIDNNVKYADQVALLRFLLMLDVYEKQLTDTQKDAFEKMDFSFIFE